MEMEKPVLAHPSRSSPWSAGKETRTSTVGEEALEARAGPDGGVSDQAGVWIRIRGLALHIPGRRGWALSDEDRPTDVSASRP